MKRIAFVLSIVTLFQVTAASGSPRSAAVGGASAVIPEAGISSSGNPAAFAFSENHTAALAYDRPFAGIGDPLGSGFLEYGHHFRPLELGFSIEHFQSRMFSRSEGGIFAAKRFGNIAAGLRFRGILEGYNPDNFDYGDGDDPDDPVFVDGESKIGITGDFGLMWNAGKVAIGLLGANLLDPDLALKSDGESRLGREISMGVSYDLGRTGRLFANAGYGLSAPDGEEISYGAGFESPLLTPLDIRAGFGSNEVAFGLGFHLPGELPLRLDYAFGYPLSDLGRVSTSHRFGLVLEMEPKVVRPDLAISIAPDGERYPMEDTVRITIIVKNSYLKANRPFLKVTAGEQVIHEETLPDLGAEENIEREVDYPLTEAGEVVFSAEVDPEGLIEENNEDNNSAKASTRAFSPPVPAIAATPSVLRVEEIKYSYQDESIVPAVFFEEGSANIQKRFDSLLDLLAQRLRENPDATFVIDGFFDPLSEEGQTQLAEERESALIKALKGRVPGFEDRIVPGERPPGEKRIDRVSQYDEYQEYINEENRRAEISVRLRGMEFEVRPDEFDAGDAADMAGKVGEHLRNNPFAMVLVRSSEAGIDLDRALSRSLKVKNLLLDQLPELYEDRVLASAAEGIEEGKTVVLLSGDGIVYKPREVHSARNLEPEALDDCIIRPSVESELDIRSWRIFMRGLDGRELFEIASGEGTPPERLTWDWKRPDGGMIPFGKRFVMCLSVTGELGQSGENCTEKRIGTEVIRREERTDRLLLVQFLFDAPSTRSKYLRDRLEWVARHIIERGGAEGVVLSAELQGHTDIIGGDRRNLELSSERAETVEDRLKAYMRVILDLPDMKALESWMEDNNVVVTSKGYGSDKPYSLDLRRGGELTEVTVGDNETPEGRAINRRVIVVIHEIQEKGGDSDD